MTKQKYSFPGPTCPGCQYHHVVGGVVSGTRYCNGFPKRRKPKRFRKSDPKYKPPKWCPRLISPPVCRVYGFVNEESEFLEWCLNRRDYKPGAHISPSEYRYKPRVMTATPTSSWARWPGPCCITAKSTAKVTWTAMFRTRL